MKHISEYYQFPIARTREDYKLNYGGEAPQYNPFQPLKFWEDKVGHDLYNVVTIVNGQPTVTLVPASFFSRTVNIHDASDMSQYPTPTITQEVAVPINPLPEGSKLVLVSAGFGFQNIMVETPEDRAPENLSDHQMIVEIYKTIVKK